jgi:hypothetical protein
MANAFKTQCGAGSSSISLQALIHDEYVITLKNELTTCVDAGINSTQEWIIPINPTKLI